MHKTLPTPIGLSHIKSFTIDQRLSRAALDMAKLSCYLIFPLGLSWLIIPLVMVPSSSAESDVGNGFTIDLIHRDSHKSPSYDPSATLLDRHLRALSCSISRTNSIGRRRRNLRDRRLSVEDVKSELYPAGGEYYMEIAIGMPPVRTLVIADTGSDLTWTQCKPCNPCYPQRPPIFDPDNSSSYHLVSCPSDTCKMLGEAGSCSQLGTCQYNYFYGDGSVTGGDVDRDREHNPKLELGESSHCPEDNCWMRTQQHRDLRRQGLRDRRSWRGPPFTDLSDGALDTRPVLVLPGTVQ